MYDVRDMKHPMLIVRQLKLVQISYIVSKDILCCLSWASLISVTIVTL